MSEGIPFAFRDCPGIYEAVRDWVAIKLDVDPKEVNLTGSARLGQSLSPRKIGRPFGEGSDLDVFVISTELFNRLKSDFDEWSYDFESGNVKPSNEREAGFWKDNLHRCPKNIFRGFIDSNVIPNHQKYQCVKNISQTMYLLKEKLGVTPGAPKVCHASVRCYKSWGDYVRQVSLGLM
ncbi:hypothetical protein Mag101_07895 [Microbulbifer agarilyticus]|uniref:Uncharacterized protein n=1 Tax=Microbulbifer agarilyticus TaxID=260552 RepID=A0A1Q2M9U0_9GAMM|nr:hypothetical protein Mag101_07895 [Microbulbifer agarilyticus]